MRKTLVRVCMAALLAASVSAGCGDNLVDPNQDPGNGEPGSPPEDGATELPPSAVEQIEALIAEKEARTPSAAQDLVFAALPQERSLRDVDRARVQQEPCKADPRA